MADETSKGYPYPELGDAPNIENAVKPLAEKVDERGPLQAVTQVERDALGGDDLWTGRAVFNTDAAQVEVWDADAQAWLPAAEGVTDHGELSGLGDDDHQQYALADGSRGDFEESGAVGSHEGATDPHSQYLDEASASATYQPQQLLVERDDQDDDDLWRTARYRRHDGTLFMESVLGPQGEGPEYPERVVTWYEADGTTVRDSVTLDLTYDGDGELVSEGVQS